MVPHRGPAVRLFRCPDRLEPLVSPVPCRTYVVMITYYAAQYLFYLFAVKSVCPQIPATETVTAGDSADRCR